MAQFYFLESIGCDYTLTLSCDEILCVSNLVLGWENWNKVKSILMTYVFRPIENILSSLPVKASEYWESIYLNLKNAKNLPHQVHKKYLQVML